MGHSVSLKSCHISWRVCTQAGNHDDPGRKATEVLEIERKGNLRQKLRQSLVLWPLKRKIIKRGRNLSTTIQPCLQRGNFHFEGVSILYYQSPLTMLTVWCNYWQYPRGLWTSPPLPCSPISPHPIFHPPPSFMLANKSVLCRISQIENKFWFSLWIFSHVVVSEVNVNNGTNILSRCHDRKCNIIPTNLCTDPLNGGSALSPKYRTSAADSFQSSDKLPVFQ